MNIILIIGTVLAFATTIISGIVAREFMKLNEDAIFTINFNNLKRLISDMSVTKRNFNLIKLGFSTLVSEAKELNRVKELDLFFREKFKKFIKMDIIRETSELQLRVNNKIIELETDIAHLKEMGKKVVQSDPEEYDRLRRLRLTNESILISLKGLL